MKKLCLILIILITGIAKPCFGQNLDSLWKVYNDKNQADTNRLKGIHEVVRSYIDSKPDTAIFFAEQELKFARATKQKKFEAKALNAIGASYGNKKDSLKTLKYYFEALQIREEIKDEEGIAQTYFNIAHFYNDQYELSKAIVYYNKCLKILEKIGDKDQLMISYYKLGGIYRIQSNYPKALDCFLKGLKISEELDSKEGISAFYNDIGIVFSAASNQAKALEYYQKALKIYEETSNKAGKAACYNRIGGVYASQSNYLKAKDFFLKAEKLWIETGIKNGLWICYNLIGEVYQEEHNYHKAIEYYLKGLEVAKKISDKRGVQSFYSSLGKLYNILSKYKIAIQYSDSLLQLCKETGSIDGNESEAYQNLALAYSGTGKYKEAYECYVKYKTLTDSIYNGDNSKKLNDMQNNFAEEKREAEQAKLDAIALSQKKQQQFVIYAVTGILLIVIIFSGILYKRFRLTNTQKEIIKEQKGKIENSFNNLELLNTISNEITSSLNLNSVMNLIYKNVSSLMDISFFIISTYDNKEEAVEVKFCVKEGVVVSEDFKTSVLNPNSFTALTIKNKNEIIISDLEKEYPSYLNGSPQLHGKEDLWCESLIFIPLIIKEKVIGLFSVQSKNKNAFTKSNIDILRSLSSVIAVALNNADSYQKLDNANIEISKQKHLVEEKQQEIIDSITYAKRLQQAILPSIEEVKKQLPESFVYYQPKDIVAGDFYWMHSRGSENTDMSGESSRTSDLSSQYANLTFIAAADCTGHGVPGAMVSVVCSNALNRAVNEFNLTDTGLILDKTRGLVIETFEKSDSEVKDGMDISLLRIEKNIKETKVQWSGANNSLWYVLNNELIEVKADKQPIGKYSDPTPFTSNNFTFNEPVSLYLFSDGYADQFSPEDKKLMKKKFKDIILSIQDLSMNEQKSKIEKVHIDWKGTMEQTDDVLVIGVKI